MALYRLVFNFNFNYNTIQYKFIYMAAISWINYTWTNMIG